MRIRGWWLAVALVAVVILGWFATVITVERVNRRAYVRDGEALAAAGFVVDWQTVLDGLPVNDPTAQAAWEAWGSTAPSLTASDEVERWLGNPDRHIPADLATDIAAAKPQFGAGLAALDAGVGIGLRGSLRERINQPIDQWLSSSNLMASRSLATWLRWKFCANQMPRKISLD